MPNGHKLDSAAKRLLIERICAGDGFKAAMHWLDWSGHKTISEATFSYYRNRKDVKAAIAQANSDALTTGIAVRDNRIAGLQERHSKLLRVVYDRASAPEMQDVPGGRTGVLVKTEKQIGNGKNAVTVEEYLVDVPLLRELREIEKHIAQEVGQWTQKHEMTGKDGGPIEVDDVTALTPDERRRRLREILAGAEARAQIADGPEPDEADDDEPTE